MQKSNLVAVLATLTFSSLAWPQNTQIDTARQFFAHYVTLENSHDPGVADLYADETYIRNRRSMPMGDPQVVTIPAAKYKARLHQSMSMAKARGERSTYSNVTCKQEGDFVRIEALRILEPRLKSSPFSLLVGPSRGGKWLIYEELSESRQ